MERSHRPLVGAAAIACRGCRKLKMRCVGAENPPCERCEKAGRECIVAFLDRHNRNRSTRQKVSSHRDRQQNSPAAVRRSQAASGRDGRKRQTIIVPASGANTSAASSSGHSDPSPLRSDQPQGLVNTSSASDLPSVYSTSAIAVLTSPTPEISETHSINVTHSRSRIRDSQSRAVESRTPEINTPTDNELAQMIQFFKKKILYYVPVISPTDIEDVGNLVGRKRHLAYCLAFVAARFVPGCEHIRRQLTHHVVQFLRDATRFSSNNEEEIWTHLLAFAVIYAYRQIGASSNDSPDPAHDEYLNQWTLKSAVETFALRLSLHRSGEDVRTLLRNSVPDIATRPEYRRYIYWLWLFTMAHHHSLVTRTPPSIREDSIIRGSPDLLKDVENDTRVLRVLAEVDLCILWGQAGRLETGLGEWWCPPPEGRALHETLGILEDADAALQVWSQRWGLVGGPRRSEYDTDFPPTGAVDFHFRFTRFCISTFATRTVHHQSTTASSFTRSAINSSLPRITAAITNSVLKSAEVASYCCDFMLDLSPLQKDSCRYIADFGFAMISFCCLYIINAFELFGSRHATLGTYIRKVEQSARLMIELSVGSNSCPKTYGEWILARIENLEARNLVSISKDGTDAGLISRLQGYPHSSTDAQRPIRQIEFGQGDAGLRNNQEWVSDYGETRPTAGMSPLADIDNENLSFSPGQEIFDDLGIDGTFIFDPRWDFLTLPP